MLREIEYPPRRILIVRMGSLGDVVRVLPMLAGLRARFPGAAIDWVVQRKAAAVLEGHPHLDRLFVVPFGRWRELLSRHGWRLRRALRARRYDLVLDFQGSIKGTFAALLAGARGVRVGWSPGHAEEGTWLLFHGHRTPPAHRVNRHLRFRCLVDWLGAPDVPGVPPPCDEADRAPVDHFLETRRDLSRPWILVFPWTSPKGAHRRWDLQRMRAAAEEIARRTAGTILVGWGPSEEEAARTFARSVPRAVLAPPTTVRGQIHLLAACDLFLGVNTGPMHLAALAGTPVVAVFGSRSDPRLHTPLERGAPVVVLAAPDAREPRRRERRGLGPFLPPDPEVVVSAALDLLSRGRDLAQQPLAEDPGTTLRVGDATSPDLRQRREGL